MKKYAIWLVVLVSLFFRLYKLGGVPPAISWDEAAVGYNAYTISHWARDEWGKVLPLVFTSFEDDKHPVHIYLTSVFVGVLGLNDFAVRLPAALFGAANVILIYLLAGIIFKNKNVGLAAAFLLAISPYSLQFSRFNHEFNFAIFFFMLGLALFYKGLENKKRLLPFAFLSFGICLYSYHSAKIVSLPLVILLIVLYFGKLIRDKKHFYFGVAIYGIFLLGIILNPQLLGLARIKQTSFSADEVKNTLMYSKTASLLLGRGEIAAKQYFWHFTPRYLFLNGDRNARHSTQVAGEFFKTDSIFMVLGLAVLVAGLFGKNRKENLFLLAWIILAPLPSALVSEAPHAARAMFMAGSWHLLAAWGLVKFLGLFKTKNLWLLPLAAILAAYLYEFSGYLKYYYGEYPRRYAIEWQYGMKQAVEYVKTHPEYYQVFVTDIRSQPYIFFLYYLKTPLPEFLKSVEYNESRSRSYSLVESFKEFQFANWETVDSWPSPVILHIMTINEYIGLRYRDWFEIKQIVKFPNGDPAFYLVSGKDDLE